LPGDGQLDAAAPLGVVRLQHEFDRVVAAQVEQVEIESKV
jgi:hypothetical protein